MTTTETELLSDLFEELFPICRSITGPGLRRSLEILGRVIPLTVEGVPSGTEVFDWTVPAEWHVRDARLTGPDGETYADFEETNLAVVNYSEPVDRRLSLEELDSHLHSTPTLPEATPYVTSYYERTWGFCLPHVRRESMPEGEYHANVDSEFVDGELNYGHATLPGETDREVLLSSYFCHPSMANNELSGPLVMALLYRRLAAWDERRYTYRFVLCPETIGSLSYLHEYGDHLREHLDAGLVLTCLGGPEETLSYKASRRGDTLFDRLMAYRAEQAPGDIRLRSFAEIFGSDERQYCSPGFDLPVGQFARTVYGRYDEYHTSADDREFMGIEPLIESADYVEAVLAEFERAGRYRNLNPCGEPMLSKRDLYPDVSSNTGGEYGTGDLDLGFGEDLTEETLLKRVLAVLQYSDGDHALLDVARKRDCSVADLVPVADLLRDHDLLERLDPPEKN